MVRIRGVLSGVYAGVIVFAFLRCADEPSAGIVRVDALSLWRRASLLLAKWPLEVVSWFARLLSQSRGRGFRFPPGAAAAAGKSQLLSVKVVGEVHFAAPAGKP